MSNDRGGAAHDIESFRSKLIQQYGDLMAISARDKRKTRRKMEEANLKQRSMDVINFRPLTYRQEEMWNTIEKNIVTIVTGCAGVGKTLVALHYGLRHIATNDFERVVYIRSDVGIEHQRGRGALPGDLSDKIRPLVMPIYDNMPYIVRSQGAADYLMERGHIEAVLLEDVRGRSFSDSVVIVDEGQNFTPGQTKTVLSRIGRGSKLIFMGDTQQVDSQVFRLNNGLTDAVHRLHRVKNVGIVNFTSEDIVRNSVIKEILEAYDPVC